MIEKVIVTGEMIARGDVPIPSANLYVYIDLQSVEGYLNTGITYSFVFNLCHLKIQGLSAEYGLGPGIALFPGAEREVFRRSTIWACHPKKLRYRVQSDLSRCYIQMFPNGVRRLVWTTQ